ncbi:MAG: class I tRNA ligase family protein [Patescibacteria group bacterium]
MVDDIKQGGEELHHAPHKPKGPLAAREEEVLEFWNKEGIFEKSLKKDAPKGDFVFYDGPPFATGLPHYGHLLQSALKDALPRYKTMQGYHVERRWGWDCHGLPLENQIEQELGLKNKRDIEKLGVEQFNEAARNAVLRYADEWRRIIPRFGRWVNMDRDYKTMDAPYTESVWWAFKNLYDQGLIYESFKSMHLCPRCGTTLSNFEVAQGYKDIDDIAVTIKLPLIDEPDTSLLVWTTTPWTLPGNAAAAVKPDATYEKVKVTDGFVIALAGKVEGEVIRTFLGKELVGKKYLPPFDYFADELHKHKTHAWKVYAGDFVTLEDGTGIVHIAPAFGQDDLALAQANKIPLIHHVTDEGKFTATVTDFAGLSVKPKGNPRETDEKIAAKLEERGLLFKKEKITHSYPHCWRCDTPLLNWAATSWFVNVQKVKQKVLKQNATVTWVPSHVGVGRFNNLLEGAPDWAISRSRYWGAPLPVWRHTKTKEVRVAGSVEDLLALARRSGNRYVVMRHGDAHSNGDRQWDCYGREDNHVTARGKEQIAQTAKRMKSQGGIDLIVTSPLLRTRETAEIMQKELGLDEKAVMVDERLREIDVGSYDGRPIAEWEAEFATSLEHFTKKVGGGETFVEIRRRTGELLFELERRYTNKRILVVTHEGTGWLLHTVAARMTVDQAAQDLLDPDLYLKRGEARELPFTPFPHNHDYELDLHRPYIDEVSTGDSLNGEWKRVPDVFDCWFESGSMPFASNHYPFNKETFDPKRLFGFGAKGYPADVIAESIDQTRGWFYSLLVLGVALFGRTPYKAVVTNGLILASDGRKMSKKLKNYPDPMGVVEKYGADALRYYLLSSPVIRGEDLRFKEQGVDEVSKKLLMRLDNVRSFYELYAPASQKPAPVSPAHVLDRWILSRLNELVEQSTQGYEGYELDVATRPLGEFVEDLSNWYIRRSRERFKEKNNAEPLATLRHVLYTVAHVMAPVMPFFADDLYRRVKSGDDPESVHLSSWPAAGTVDHTLVADMARVRVAASKGLELRERAGIKIRQPLSSLTIAAVPADPALCAIIAEEVNVKEIKEGSDVALDTELTEELREEGEVRRVTRAGQEARKIFNFNPGDNINGTIVVTGVHNTIVAVRQNEAMIRTILKVNKIETHEDSNAEEPKVTIIPDA